MRDSSVDAFAHNAWATATLVEFCKELSDTELNVRDSFGTFGCIIDTLRHCITSEGFYRFLVSGEWPNWEWSPDETPGLDVLEERVKDNAVFWEEFLARGVDPDAILTMREEDGSEAQMKLGVVVAQVLNHGNDHRSQIATMITQLGKQPPDLQAWRYGEVSGRAPIAATSDSAD